MLRMKTGWALAAIVALLGSGAGSRVVEAAIIIDGTDANDHGTASGGVNQNGWAYMQSVLENLAAATSPSAAKVLVDLGTSAGKARDAINSAFNLSSLASAGWTIQHIDGAANITSWLNNLSTANTGILYLPTYSLTGGDLTAAEMTAINGGASQMDAFTLAGGSLFAMGQQGTGAYGWLSTLLPGVTTVTGGSSTAITLTPDGIAAFPGLTASAVANAVPWHVEFAGDLGPNLKVLGTAPRSGAQRNVILGASRGSVTQPVPEPASLTSLGIAGLVGIGYAWRRRKRSA